jgi:hypothetical protein
MIDYEKHYELPEADYRSEVFLYGSRSDVLNDLKDVKKFLIKTIFNRIRMRMDTDE